MADLTIFQLPEQTGKTNDDVLAIVDSGDTTTSKIKVSTLLSGAGSLVPATGTTSFKTSNITDNGDIRGNYSIYIGNNQGSNDGITSTSGYNTLIGNGRITAGDSNFIASSNYSSAPIISVGSFGGNVVIQNGRINSTGFRGGNVFGAHDGDYNTGQVSVLIGGYFNDLGGSYSFLGTSNSYSNLSGDNSILISGNGGDVTGNNSVGLSLGTANVTANNAAKICGGGGDVSSNNAGTFVGESNTITGSTHSTIIGGKNHKIFGGEKNNIDGGDGNTISGGTANSVIEGGLSNKITGSGTTSSAIVGGSGNTNSHAYSVILGGTGLTTNYTQEVLVPNLTIAKYASLDFADDTAAAAGGIVLGQVYHNAGALRIRVV